MAKEKKVHINLNGPHGVVYVEEGGDRQDLQPVDNPHQVGEFFARELVASERAVILEDDEVADALKAKKVHPAEADKAAGKPDKKAKE